MTKPALSVIIRTKNESRWLNTVLTILGEQSYRDFEVIIVDSGSTDTTLEIARKHEVSIVELAPEDFTYPYAIDYGIKHAAATDYYLILSGHSVPIGTDWLQNAVETLKSNDRYMGVYGPLYAMPDATLSDKIFHGTAFLLKKIGAHGQRTIEVKNYITGVLGFTNALIRKDLYEKRPVDQTYAGGGEDAEWVKYWLSEGYVAVLDMNFPVHHSHYLGPLGWVQQFRHWLRVLKGPSSFKKLSYRNDGAHQ